MNSRALRHGAGPANFKPYAHASLWLIGLAWTLPFLQPYHRYPLVSFYSEWLAFALGLAAATHLLLRGVWREAGFPLVALAPIALAALIGMQAALGRVPYPEQALTAVLYLIWAALLVVLGNALRREISLPLVATMLAWFLVAGGVLNVIIGLLQHYEYSTPLDFLIARKDKAVVYGNLGQPNNYAAYLCLSLVSAASLYSRRLLHPAAAWAFVLLSLLMMGLSASRSVWLYLGALPILAALLHAYSRDTESRRLLFMMVCLLPCFVIVQWVATLPFMIPEQGGAYTATQRLFHLASGIESRLHLGAAAWDMFLASPWIGAGFGQFTWHFFLHQAQSGIAFGPKVFNHSHNVAMQLLAETGAAGAAIVAGFSLRWLWDFKRVRVSIEAWWLIALLSVVGIHGMLEYPLWYSYFLGIAALLLGLGAGRCLALRFAGAAQATVGLVILIGWLNLVALMPVYREFERLVFQPQPSASSLDEGQFAKAVVGLYREPMLVPYVDLAIAFGVTVDRSDLPEKLSLMSRVTRFAPLSDLVYRHAFLLALAGRHELAAIELDRALRVYPEDAGDAASQLKELAQARPREFEALLKVVEARRDTNARLIR